MIQPPVKLLLLIVALQQQVDQTLSYRTRRQPVPPHRPTNGMNKGIRTSSETLEQDAFPTRTYPSRHRSLEEPSESKDHIEFYGLSKWGQDTKITITNFWQGTYQQQQHQVPAPPSPTPPSPPTQYQYHYTPPQHEYQDSIFFHDYHHNYNNGQGGGGGKGGKGGKGKSKKSPAPSMTPSVSVSPSQSPSARPTTQPSKQPSHRPSDVPSDRPSQIPSSSPSHVPSKRPSSTPTARPSRSPSMSPTDIPSVSPSDRPSYIPSPSPSLSPSVSMRPSSTPSISNMPSTTHIGGINELTNVNGTVIGRQKGCKPQSKEEEVWYAEYNVMREEVSFRYLLRHSKNITKLDAMERMELALQDSLFESSIEPCDRTSTRRRWRGLQAVGSLPVEERPIALSSLPQDVEGTQSCKDSVEGEECIIVEGGLTMVFPSNYEYNMNNTELSILTQIKRTMNGNTTFWDDDDIKGVIFLGAESIGYEDQELYVASINTELPGNGDISAIGGVLIGSAALLLLVGVVGVRKRHQDYQKSSRNLLDKDLYEMSSDIGDEDSATYGESNPSPHRPPLFGNGRLRLPDDDHPPSPFEIANDDTGEYGYEVSRTPIHLQLQDVHQCTSATCELCLSNGRRNRGGGVRMIDQSEWYEQDNVDFSDLEFEGMKTGPRSYETPDTITL